MSSWVFKENLVFGLGAVVRRLEVEWWELAHMPETACVLLVRMWIDLISLLTGTIAIASH